ncbi:MAG: penicillin-binding protein 2 [Synergistaceae bacterium]|nr:penicillin-binding protein 2 [Synergistaceae bacterium]
MPRIKKSEPEEYKRSKSIWFLVYLVIALLGVATTWIQMMPDKRIVRQSQKQYWANVAVSASRGEITDRNNIPLAVSVPATSFFIDPKYWNPKSADVLTSTFGKQISKKFASPLSGRFYWVERNVSVDRASSLTSKKVPGLYTLTEKKRVYPLGSLAFHILGFCDIDDYGQAGVELAWNHILFSPPRTRYLTRGAHGSSKSIAGEKLGSKDTCGSIKLTIDSKIQQIVEWRLNEAAKNVDALWAAAVCVDPSTGEVIALASYPTLDANNRKTLLENKEAVRNNVVGRVYEPGSIFKPITMSMAMDYGSANSNSKYRCTGSIVVADRVISDVNKKAHGIQNLTQVLMNSCNIGMSIISGGVPRHIAYGMLKQFGFGEKSGIEMAGEESGLVRAPEEWLGSSAANVFIGQGIAITPLQEVMAIASIANGGFLLKPYIISEVRDSFGNIIHSGSRRVRYQSVSQSTARFISASMKKVVSEGGGISAKSSIVDIAGKTGTAQVASSGEYAKGRYVASFVGFWPADKPRYVLLVTLGEPKGGRYYGSQLSAPVFKSIVEDIAQMAPTK